MAEPKENFELISTVPCFNGETEVSVEEFLEKIEIAGGLQNWKEETKLQIAKLKLSGKARLAMTYSTVFKDADWNKFKKELKEYYSIPGYAIKYALRNCKQRQDECKREWSWRFLEMADRCGNYVYGIEDAEVFRNKQLNRDAYLAIYMKNANILEEDDLDFWWEVANEDDMTLIDVVNDIVVELNRQNRTCCSLSRRYDMTPRNVL